MNIQTVNYNGFSFLDVHNPQELELKHLRTTYGFSSLHLDDYISRVQNPTIEQYKDYILVILDFPHLESINQESHKKTHDTAKEDFGKRSIPSVITQPLSAFPFQSHDSEKKRLIHTAHVNFFLGRDYVVVLHDEKTSQIDHIFSLCQKGLHYRQEYMADGPNFLFYRIVDSLVDSEFAILSDISSTIDYIDKQLTQGNSSAVVKAISKTRRNIVVFQTVVKQAVLVFAELEKGKFQNISNLAPFWSNILDHLQKIADRLDDAKELNEGIATSHESLLTVRTNEIVKVLTIFTAILLPLTLVASIYGMNIRLPFADKSYAFLVVMEFMVIIAVTMTLIFKKRDWL